MRRPSPVNRQSSCGSIILSLANDQNNCNDHKSKDDERASVLHYLIYRKSSSIRQSHRLSRATTNTQSAPTCTREPKRRFRCVCETSRGKPRFFPPSTCRIHAVGFCAALGLRPVRQPCPSACARCGSRSSGRGLASCSFSDSALRRTPKTKGYALPAAGRTRDSRP